MPRLPNARPCVSGGWWVSGRAPRALVTAFALLSLASVARADCVDGDRKATPGELTFAARAAAALMAALPAPIANSERRGALYDFASQPVLSFCKGQPEGAFSPAAAGPYIYRFPKADADRMYTERKALEQQIDALLKLPPDKEAQYQQALVKMRAAYDAGPRRQRKDPPFTPEQQAQADRANAEGRVLEDAAKRILTEHQVSVKPQTDGLRAQMKRLETFPQEITVRLAMNVKRFPDTDALTATFGTPSARESAGLRVHNIVLSVEGPEGAATSAIFDAVDRQYLKSLLTQAPPDVAVSKERAERMAATPAATAAAPAAAPAPPTATAAPASAAVPASAAPEAAAPNTAGTSGRPSAAPPQGQQEKPKDAPAAPTGQGAVQTVKKLRGLLGR